MQKLFDLSDKVIVITGAAGLLGKQHSIAIARSGGSPILLDINKDEVHKLSEKLNNDFDCNSSSYVLDITDEKQVKNVSLKIMNKYNRVDGLVNNAAINPKIENNDKKNFSRLENFPLQAWIDDIAVGLTGSFLCSKYFGALISKNTNGGSIVNISSDLGIMAPDQRLYKVPGISDELQPVKPVTYSVIKSGLIGLTRYLSTYWIDKNVRCNAICPGGVENNQPSDFLCEVEKRIPMGRLANADEYQGTLIWMLSKESSYLNGAIIPVDGGRTAW